MASFSTVPRPTDAEAIDPEVKHCRECGATFVTTNRRRVNCGNCTDSAKKQYRNSALALEQIKHQAKQEAASIDTVAIAGMLVFQNVSDDVKAEMTAIGSCAAVIEALDGRARMRVLEWLRSRYMWER